MQYVTRGPFWLRMSGERDSFGVWVSKTSNLHYMDISNWILIYHGKTKFTLVYFGEECDF